MNSPKVWSNIRRISHFFFLLIVCCFLGILPMGSVLAKTLPSPQAPIFNPEKVHLGITPTGWSNSDDPTIDLYPRIPYQQIMSEIALSGFKGTQNSPKFPKYPEEANTLKSELGMRNIVISEPWVSTEFTVPGKYDATLEEFAKQVAFIKDMGGTRIVVAEFGGAVHLSPVDPLTNRPHFSDEQWQSLTNGLNELGAIANKEGLKLVYHPHMGTGVMDLTDIDRLMSNTDPRKVGLLLDTGHLYYAGVDPLEVTKKYIDRIAHAHLKNIRQPILDAAVEGKYSFFNAIREGIFTVPGDPAGTIDFVPIFAELAKANYEGWLVVEAEQDPNKANPLQYALMARNYLRQVTGL